MNDSTATAPASTHTFISAEDKTGRRIHFGIFLLVAFLLAVCLSWNANGLNYDQQLLRVKLENTINPEVYDLVRDSPELHEIFMDYADDHELSFKAQLAIEKYKDSARRVLASYGAEAEFQDALRLYGENIVPVIDFFIQNDLKSVHAQMLAKEKIGAAVKGVKSFSARVLGKDSAPVATPKAVQAYGPEKRGLIAIEKIASQGHQFLGQFEIDATGTAHWLQTQRALDGLVSLFTSGVVGLERKVRRQEEIKIADVVWAGVDVVGVLSVAKAFKLFKGAATVKRTGKTLSSVERAKVLTRTVLGQGTFGRKMLVWGAKAGVVYLIVTNPGLLNSLFARLAEFLGIPAFLMQLVGWTLLFVVLLYPFIFIARGLLFVAVPVITALVRCLKWLQLRFFRPKMQDYSGSAAAGSS